MYDPSTTGSHSLTRATNVNGRAMAGTVCSWFDSGVRLTPAVAPVASWYDSGVRLKLPPVDMLEAFRSELHKAERQATEEQEALLKAIDDLESTMRPAAMTVDLVFQGRTQRARVAADRTTDALYKAAAQAYAQHVENLSLSFRGIRLREGVALGETLLANLQDQKVLVMAKPARAPTIEEIYGSVQPTAAPHGSSQPRGWGAHDDVRAPARATPAASANAPPPVSSSPAPAVPSSTPSLAASDASLTEAAARAVQCAAKAAEMAERAAEAAEGAAEAARQAADAAQSALANAQGKGRDGRPLKCR